MEVEIEKQNICVNQIISKKTDVVIAEGDIIIPDIKPDILSAICINGTVCIYKKEIQDGKVKIEGGVNVYVMYMADSDRNNIRSINTTIDFTKIVEIDQIKSGMKFNTKMSLKNIDCKILNGRKINIKSIIDTEVTVFSEQRYDFIKEVNNIKNLQTLNQEIQFNSLLGSGETRAYAKDTIIIENTDDLADILKSDIQIINREVKTSYNKILVKADILTNLLYITEDNRIKQVNATIPIMGFIDMQDVSDNAVCDVNYEIRNIIIKPNNVEEHSIYVETEIEIQCFAYETRKMNLIQDLYSPNEEIQTAQKNIKVIQDKRSVKTICNIRERQVISEIQENQLVSVEVMAKITKQNNLNDKIMCDGEIELKLMYLINNGQIQIKEQTIPFSCSIENVGNINQNTQISNIIEILNQDFIISNDNLEIKIDLIIISDLSTDITMNVINEITRQEQNIEDPYSVIIYFVKPGDSLWKIAKRFNSTIANIAAVNDIEDVDKIMVGQQLFIPVGIGISA